MNEKSNGTVVITEWKRNESEVGRLTVDEFNGREIVHLRIWARDKQGELVPTTRGITIPLDKLPQPDGAYAKWKRTSQLAATPCCRQSNANGRRNSFLKSWSGILLTKESVKYRMVRRHVLAANQRTLVECL